MASRSGLSDAHLTAHSPIAGISALGAGNGSVQEEERRLELSRQLAAVLLGSAPAAVDAQETGAGMVPLVIEPRASESAAERARRRDEAARRAQAAAAERAAVYEAQVAAVLRAEALEQHRLALAREEVLRRLARLVYPSYADFAAAFFATHGEQPAHRHARARWRGALEREGRRYDRYALRLTTEPPDELGDWIEPLEDALRHPTAMTFAIAFYASAPAEEMISPAAVLWEMGSHARAMRNLWHALHPDVVVRRRAERRTRRLRARVDAIRAGGIQFRQTEGGRWVERRPADGEKLVAPRIGWYSLADARRDQVEHRAALAIAEGEVTR